MCKYDYVCVCVTGNLYPYHHIGDHDVIGDCAVTRISAIFLLQMQQDADPSTRPEQPPDSTFTINHIVICVPYFWPEKPAAWFAQLEGQFALSNITKNATKFHYVISQIRCLSLSKEQYVCQLLMHEEVGDRRPTQFLYHLWILACLSIPSDFLCA